MKTSANLMAAFMVAATLATPVTAGTSQGIVRDPEGDLLTNNAGETVRLPVCRDNIGVKVRFQLINRRNPMESVFWMAFSTFGPKSGPVTQFYPEFMDMPSEVIAFAAEHECAHHMLGHPREHFNMYALNSRIDLGEEQIHAYEKAADCIAAQALHDKYGYGETDFARIFYRFPANENSPTHPPTQERLEHVRLCYENQGRSP